LFLCSFADLAQRFEKRGLRINFIVDFVEGFPLLDNPQVIEVFQLSLCRMQGETRFKHDLSLIKSPAGMGEKKVKDPSP